MQSSDIKMQLNFTHYFAVFILYVTRLQETQSENSRPQNPDLLLKPFLLLRSQVFAVVVVVEDPGFNLFCPHRHCNVFCLNLSTISALSLLN